MCPLSKRNSVIFFKYALCCIAVCVVMEKDRDQLERSCEKWGITKSQGKNTVSRRKDNWIGHILHRNCLLKHIIQGRMEVTKRRGRRRKRLLNDF